MKRAPRTRSESRVVLVLSGVRAGRVLRAENATVAAAPDARVAQAGEAVGDAGDPDGFRAPSAPSHPRITTPPGADEVGEGPTLQPGSAACLEPSKFALPAPPSSFAASSPSAPGWGEYARSNGSMSSVSPIGAVSSFAASSLSAPGWGEYARPSSSFASFASIGTAEPAVPRAGTFAAQPARCHSSQSSGSEDNLDPRELWPTASSQPAVPEQQPSLRITRALHDRAGQPPTAPAVQPNHLDPRKLSPTPAVLEQQPSPRITPAHQDRPGQPPAAPAVQSDNLGPRELWPTASSQAAVSEQQPSPHITPILQDWSGQPRAAPAVQPAARRRRRPLSNRLNNGAQLTQEPAQQSAAASSKENSSMPPQAPSSDATPVSRSRRTFKWESYDFGGDGDDDCVWEQGKEGSAKRQRRSEEPRPGKGRKFEPPIGLDVFGDW